MWGFEVLMQMFLWIKRSIFNFHSELFSNQHGFNMYHNNTSYFGEMLGFNRAWMCICHCMVVI